MDSWLIDLRTALRSLGRDRLFSLVVIATLGLAIGSSTAMFAVVNTVLLQPLPFPDETQLVRVRNVDLAGGERVRSNLPGLEAELMRADRRTFDDVVAMSGEDRLLQLREGAARVSLVRTDAGWTRTLGVQPAIGRFFTDDEFRVGEASGVAVIAHRLWLERFAGGPLGDGAIALGDRSYRVVGVFPPAFNFPYVGDVWIPARPSEIRAAAVFARLAPGISIVAAQERTRAFTAEIRTRFPELGAAVELELEAARASLIEEEDRTTTALLGVAAGFLLIAAANVANLMLARALLRRRELAIRAALGSGRLRQYRHLALESLLLALAGGGVGLLASSWLLGPLGRLLPENWTHELQFAGVQVDWRVAAFAMVTAVGIGAVITVLALWRNSRVPAREVLASGSRGSSATTTPVQRALVAAQVGLTLTVLAATGLLVGHARSLTTAPLGLDADRLMTLRLQLPEESRYQTPDVRAHLAQAAADAASAVPGVDGAAILTANPLSDATVETAIDVEGRPAAAGDSRPRVNHRLVTPRFAAVLGLRVLRGRTIADTDAAGNLPVAVVSQRMADRLWPGADPLGRRVRVAAVDAPWLTVVGVVSDVRDSGDVQLTWYLPYAQQAGMNSARFLHVMARAAGATPPDVRAIERAIRAVEPGVAVYDVLPMRQVYVGTLDRDRLGSFVALLFGSLGLLLAAVGVYGVTALFVSAHRVEFGVRAALGADAARITGFVLRRAGVLLALGLAVGGLGAVAIAQWLRSVIPGLAASPAPVVLGAVVLAAIGLTAAYVPARRAGRVSPMTALKTD